MRKETADLGFEQLDETRLHVRELVWNAETDDPLTGDLRLEPCLKLGLVVSLHDKDEICPVQQFGCDWVFCVMSEAGRRALYAWPGGEDLLCRGTAPTIATANEEDAKHGCIAAA
jgi:hypothetical protein